jgi:MinD superfamily P-loop ATPase
LLDIGAPDKVVLRQNSVRKKIKENIKNVRVINDDKCNPCSHCGNKYGNVANTLEIPKQALNWRYIERQDSLKLCEAPLS